MPMTPELRRGIDRIRDYLFGGGYPNPAQNAEQLSFLIYFYMYESADAARVRAAQRPGAEDWHSVFDGEWILRDPRNAREPSKETVPRSFLRCHPGRKPSMASVWSTGCEKKSFRSTPNSQQTA